MNRPSTVWAGNDKDLLEWLIPFSCRREPSQILDPTFGRGRFWVNSKYLPILAKSDLNPVNCMVEKADFRKLPCRDGLYDCIVWDPPHISESGKDGLIAHRCGFGDAGEENISDLFEPALKEFKRVLVDDGVVLVKIADQVHRCRQQLQHVDLINKCHDLGLTVCDLYIKVRKSAVQGKWKNCNHARKFHCFWIVVRKSKKC